MRRPPPYRRLQVDFYGETFAADVTIGFEANRTDDCGPSRSITVEAGRRGTWLVTFAPGADLPPHTRVGFRKLENEFRFAWRHQDYWPDARDYVTVEDGEGNALPFETETWPKSKVPAIVTLPDGLRSGRAFVLRMGDQRRGGPGSDVNGTTYGCVRLRAGVLLPGDSAFREAGTVRVRVVPCPPVRHYHVFAPSQAAPHEPFEAVALPLDINGNAMSTPGGIELAGAAEVMAVSSFGTVRVRAGNGERILLHDRGNGIEASSNPTRRLPDTEHNIYWGEFHCHSFDGAEINVLNEDTHPEKAYRYGREATGLDFCALGSHIFRNAPDAVHEWWELGREAATRHNKPGRYLTFLGAEWRDTEPKGGDRNLVWRDLDAPAPDPTWRIEEVYERFSDGQAMVIPHVGGTPATPHRHNPDVESLCEMVSGHGQFEWFAQAYLQKGYKVGLIGGSDCHHATPGHPRRVTTGGGGRFARTLRLRDSGWAGGPVLAVLAQELSRDALWRAFRARRTYATTGARALLGLHANGTPMGSQIRARRDVEIEIAFEGTAPVEQIDLVRGDRRLQRWPGCGVRFREKLVDCPPSGQTYYYVRVEQTDGELLWSSPVWVDSTCGGTDEALPAWNEPEEVDLESMVDPEDGKYLSELRRYLRTEENYEAFGDITPCKVVDSPSGFYAVFLGYMRGKRIRIHWFPEFELPRIRLEAGWVQYGRERIWGADWAEPLFGGEAGI